MFHFRDRRIECLFVGGTPDELVEYLDGRIVVGGEEDELLDGDPPRGREDPRGDALGEAVQQPLALVYIRLSSG